MIKPKNYTKFVIKKYVLVIHKYAPLLPDLCSSSRSIVLLMNISYEQKKGCLKGLWTEIFWTSQICRPHLENMDLIKSCFCTFLKNAQSLLTLSVILYYLIKYCVARTFFCRSPTKWCSRGSPWGWISIAFYLQNL